MRLYIENNNVTSYYLIMDNILIVDDSESITQVLKASILDLGEYNIFICHSLKETQDLLALGTDFLMAVLGFKFR